MPSYCCPWGCNRRLIEAHRKVRVAVRLHAQVVMMRRGHLRGVDGPLTTQLIMGCIEAMTTESERVVNNRMDLEKLQRLPCRLEAAHVAFPLPAGLVRHLGPIVHGPSCLKGCHQTEIPLGGGITSQLVIDQLPSRSPCPFKSLLKKRLVDLASLRLVT